MVLKDISDTTVSEGETLKLEFSAIVKGIKWNYNYKEITNGDKYNIDPQTGALTITNVTFEDAGYYRVLYEIHWKGVYQYGYLATVHVNGKVFFVRSAIDFVNDIVSE